ncbi:serine protease [Roseibium sp. MMSF_3412]|uniref:S1 family peptidase n=1 Tax=Roseibium sp. MMSF_3412 TaxID=3046712 RepID=UPI00273DC890|nr:serine protease [Roseibium sp. MMSF_3412]
MRTFIFAGLLFFSLATTSSLAREALDLDAPFDPRAWTSSELAFIQAALALNLDYYSDADGIWGKRSRKALRDYFERDEKSKYLDKITNLFALGIVIDTEIMFRSSNWKNVYFEELDVTLFLPDADYETTDGFIDVYIGAKENYVFEKFTGPKSAMQKYLWTQSKHFEILKDRREKGVWLTFLKSERRSGYVISRSLNRTWNTVAVYVSNEDLGILNLLLATMTLGEHPNMIELSPRMMEVTDEFLRQWRAAEQERDDYLNSEAGNRQNQSEKEPDQETKRPDAEEGKNSDAPKLGAGTGFVVTGKGHVLTNAHVVKDCDKLDVNGYESELLAMDEQFDLALLLAPEMPVTRVATFANAPARLNSDVTIAGYPLHGLLGGLNITRGAVAAHKGIGGNGINMQITAPVQPGNSGGPAVDAAGNVVGVVVAKLNTVAALELLGDIPQNINFAIRGSIAQLFLHQNGVSADLDEEDEPIAPETIAEELSEYTLVVRCNG